MSDEKVIASDVLRGTCSLLLYWEQLCISYAHLPAYLPLLEREQVLMKDFVTYVVRIFELVTKRYQL